MSLAKQGRTYSRTTRRSMSRAHLSLSHSPVSHAAIVPAAALALRGHSWGSSDYASMKEGRGRHTSFLRRLYGTTAISPAAGWHEEQEGRVTCDGASFSAVGTRKTTFE